MINTFLNDLAIDDWYHLGLIGPCIDDENSLSTHEVLSQELRAIEEYAGEGEILEKHFDHFISIVPLILQGFDHEERSILLGHQVMRTDVIDEFATDIDILD